MFRMKSLASFLAVAMLVSLVSFAHAQTGTATTPAKTAAAGTSKMAGDAKKTTTTADKSTSKMAGDTKKEMAAKSTDMAKYDLNTSSKEDLMKIPGIADATAEKIVAGRPWKMKSDLVKKGVMNSAMYRKASPYMIAKTAK